MDARAIRAIASKELADILSQKVYWLAFFLELIVVLGVILLGIAFAALMNPAKMSSNVPGIHVRIGLVDLSQSPDREAVLGSLGDERVELIAVGGLETAKREVASGNLMGALILADANQQSTAKTLSVVLLSDPSRPYASMVRAKVESAVSNANERLASDRARSLGMDPAELLPITTFHVGQSRLPVSSPAFVEAMYLMVVPLVLILPILLSASMTSDSIVGEKEAGTLGTLMASPISRFDIVLGKVLPVVGLANLQFVAWMLVLERNLLGSIQVFNKGVVLLVLNLGCMSFVGAAVIVSAKSSSSKESNLYLTLLVMALIFPLLLGVPNLGPGTQVVEDLLLVRLLASLVASPNVPAAVLGCHLLVLAGLAALILGACIGAIRGLEPPPSA